MADNREIRFQRELERLEERDSETETERRETRGRETDRDRSETKIG
jgi:hypothetical protein